MPLYTEGKYDPSAVPEVLGSLGETSYEESSIDVSTAEALPDGWNFLLDGSKISVNGSFQTQTAAADLLAGKMILISGESQRAYQLTQTPSEGDDGTNVTVKGWTAGNGIFTWNWTVFFIIRDICTVRHKYIICQNGFKSLEPILTLQALQPVRT